MTKAYGGGSVIQSKRSGAPAGIRRKPQSSARGLWWVPYSSSSRMVPMALVFPSVNSTLCRLWTRVRGEARGQESEWGRGRRKR